MHAAISIICHCAVMRGEKIMWIYSQRRSVLTSIFHRTARKKNFAAVGNQLIGEISHIFILAERFGATGKNSERFALVFCGRKVPFTFFLARSPLAGKMSRMSVNICLRIRFTTYCCQTPGMTYTANACCVCSIASSVLEMSQTQKLIWLSCCTEEGRKIKACEITAL